MLQIEDRPDLELTPEQLGDVDWVIKRKRGLIGHDTGLGKTVIGIEFLKRLQSECTLILGTVASTAVWLDECNKWGLEIPTVISGTPQQRLKMWQNNKPGIYCATYQTYKLDCVKFKPKDFVKYDTLICDEAHKIGKRGTKGFDAVKKLRTANLFLATATAVIRDASDLWIYLHLINRRTFPSFWKFVGQWMIVDDGPWGKEILGVRHPDKLRAMLGQYMVRRTVDFKSKKVQKFRGTLPAELTPYQRKIYDDLENEMIAILDDVDDIIVASQAMTIMLRLRQLLVCPRLLNSDITDIGGGLRMILDHIEEREEHSRHVAIFTPFSKALPFIKEALEERGLGPVVTLKGGMSVKQVQEALAAFRSEKGIAICTIKFAESFSMDTAYAGYFLGYEWTVAENHQAEGRVFRFTTEHNVNIYYTKHKGTVDERQLEILNDKQANQDQIYKGENVKQVRNLFRDPKKLVERH